jgi:ankyrin repeat protein
VPCLANTTLAFILPRQVIIERNSERLAQMSSAVASGDLESINALCAAGFDINLGNYDHQTALHLAARVGNASVTSLLIDHSANVNAVNRWRSTPIKVAIDSQHGAVAEVLQAHGAVLKLNNPARRILDAVRRTDINYLQMLITAGVDVNSVDYDLRTGLHIAAAEGNLRMAEYLIVALADVNAADRWGRTPCDDAFEAEEMVVMQLMLRASARPNLVALAPKLRAAAACADTRKLQFLVDIGIGVQDICMASPHYDGRTALHHAVRCGSLTATYQLVMAMMDVNQRDSWGRTALNDALSISSEIAALLLRAGATLPPPYCDDAELQARVELASKVNMYQVRVEERAKSGCCLDCLSALRHASRRSGLRPRRTPGLTALACSPADAPLSISSPPFPSLSCPPVLSLSLALLLSSRLRSSRSLALALAFSRVAHARSWARSRAARRCVATSRSRPTSSRASSRSRARRRAAALSSSAARARRFCGCCAAASQSGSRATRTRTSRTARATARAPTPRAPTTSATRTTPTSRRRLRARRSTASRPRAASCAQCCSCPRRRRRCTSCASTSTGASRSRSSSSSARPRGAAPSTTPSATSWSRTCC